MSRFIYPVVPFLSHGVCLSSPHLCTIFPLNAEHSIALYSMFLLVAVGSTNVHFSIRRCITRRYVTTTPSQCLIDPLNMCSSPLSACLFSIYFIHHSSLPLSSLHPCYTSLRCMVIKAADRATASELLKDPFISAGQHSTSQRN